jgi:hypothetical protein
MDSAMDGEFRSVALPRAIIPGLFSGNSATALNPDRGSSDNAGEQGILITDAPE